jgi:site-specific recombinase XerD
VQETALSAVSCTRFKAFFREKTLFLGFRRSFGEIQLLTECNSRAHFQKSIDGHHRETLHGHRGLENLEEGKLATISAMKDELHARLWAAQERWFALKESGATKHELKLQGVREREDMFYCTRGLLFTGATRIAYERELKHFLDYCHEHRGKTENGRIDKRDFRAYMEDRLSQGGKVTQFNKMRSAISKFGALYGKYDSFHAMSKWVGEKIREMNRVGLLAGPDRPHVTPDVQQAAVERLRDLDRKHEIRTGQLRGYSLALELQKEGGLRSVEATERFTRLSLAGVQGECGLVTVLGKGGRMRTVDISLDLYRRLEGHFRQSASPALASLRPYQVALSRATLAVGGRATGSHANRRTSATDFYNDRYHHYRAQGFTPEDARRRAVEDTVERLGHSRNRKDVALAYLSR